MEKARILRAEGADLTELDEVLEEINNTDVNNPELPWKELTAKARKALDNASRK